MLCEINLPGYLLHLQEKKIQTLLLFGLFALQYFMEHIFPQHKSLNRVKNEGFNLLVGIFNTALFFLPSALLVQLLYVIELNQFGILQWIQMPLWVRISATIVVMDFFMYWWHRFNHGTQILWRFHKFHHQDKMMNSTTAMRFHTIELFFSLFFKATIFLLAGFSFLPILIYETVFFLAIVVHHSNIRITESVDMLYRKLFSSPMMHRIHHSNKSFETNSNYGSVFSFWDRIFGSYLKKASGPINFGVDEAKN